MGIKFGLFFIQFKIKDEKIFENLFEKLFRVDPLKWILGLPLEVRTWRLDFSRIDPSFESK